MKKKPYRIMVISDNDGKKDDVFVHSISYEDNKFKTTRKARYAKRCETMDEAQGVIDELMRCDNHMNGDVYVIAEPDSPAVRRQGL